jgi:hypothetical protein
MNHLKGVFVGCQESLIAAPTFDEREAARLARCVCQSIDDILKKIDNNIPQKIRNEIFRHNNKTKKQKKRRRQTWQVVLSHTPQTTRWIPSTQTFNSMAE